MASPVTSCYASLTVIIVIKSVIQNQEVSFFMITAKEKQEPTNLARLAMPRGEQTVPYFPDAHL